MEHFSPSKQSPQKDRPKNGAPTASPREASKLGSPAKDREAFKVGSPEPEKFKFGSPLKSLRDSALIGNKSPSHSPVSLQREDTPIGSPSSPIPGPKTDWRVSQRLQGGTPTSPLSLSKTRKVHSELYSRNKKSLKQLAPPAKKKLNFSLSLSAEQENLELLESSVVEAINQRDQVEIAAFESVEPGEAIFMSSRRTEY